MSRNLLYTTLVIVALSFFILFNVLFLSFTDFQQGNLNYLLFYTLLKRADDGVRIV